LSKLRRRSQNWRSESRTRERGNEVRGREIERVLFVEEEPGVEVGAENSPGRGDHTEGRVAVDLLRGLRRGGVGLGIDREEVVADHVIDQGKIVVGHVIDQESIAVDHVIDQGEVVADQKRGPGKEGADQGKGQRVKIKGIEGAEVEAN
jgi:hypothetical protein